jgi:hypothetical protein
MNAKRDENRVTTLLAASSVDKTPVLIYGDPTTHRLLCDVNLSGTTLSSHIKRDQFTSTNNQTQFTASQTIIADMLFIVNGQIQAPTFDYTIVGNVYTLGTGIPAGLQVLALYIY